MNLLLLLKRTHFHGNNTFRDRLPLSFTSFRWCWQLSLKNRSSFFPFRAGFIGSSDNINYLQLHYQTLHPSLRHQLSHTWKIISSLPFSVSSLITSDCMLSAFCLVHTFSETNSTSLMNRYHHSICLLILGRKNCLAYVSRHIWRTQKITRRRTYKKLRPFCLH